MPEIFFPPLDELSKPSQHLALPERTAAADKEAESSVEETITRYEKELGIDSKMDRLAEASLFIDQKFLRADIITGNNQHSERFFGDEAWANWLAARIRAKAYGRRPLTPEFVVQLQYIITKDGGVIDADPTTLNSSMAAVPEQLAVIKSDPHPQFINHVLEGKGNEGEITYPSVRWNGERTGQSMLPELKGVCDWYNQERIKPDYDPFKAAAGLCHRLNSIHALGDTNGRLSQLLMDWSLENDHLEPSVRYDPSGDPLNSEEELAKQVQFGSQFARKQQHARQEALESIDHEDAAFMFGVENQRTFYDVIYQHLGGAIIPGPGDANAHHSCEQFWAHFGDEYQEYKAESTSTSVLESARKNFKANEKTPPELMVQGGLIPESYIKLVKSGKPFPESIKNAFFGSLELYRGGMSSRLLTDRDLCHMFTHYIGIGTGYRALETSYTAAMSPRPVSPDNIVYAMGIYNQALAADYIALRNLKIKKKHEHDESDEYIGYYSKVADLVATHTGSGKHDGSPFASMSVNEVQAYTWANKFDSLFKSDSSEPRHVHGVLITSAAPLYGALQTFSDSGIRDRADIPMLAKSNGFWFRYPYEREVLLAGGVDPNSIEQVCVFDNQAKALNNIPAIIASRQYVDGQVHITIKNYLESKTRTYAYNAQTKSYEFIEEADFDMADEGITLQDGKLVPISKHSPDTSSELHELEAKLELEQYEAHLIAGTAPLIEIDKFIYYGQGLKVLEHLDKIKPENHTHVAEQLILYGWSSNVIDSFDQFHITDKFSIARALINTYHGPDVLLHFELFQDLDHNALAQLLINTKQLPELILNLHKFNNLNDTIASQLIAKGCADDVKHTITHFSNLEKSTLKQLESGGFEETEAHFNAVVEAMMSHLADGTANMHEIQGLIDGDYGNAVIDSLDHINATYHPAIAEALITRNWGMGVIQNLNQFENLDHKKVVQKLIANYDGWMVAQNVDKFASVPPNGIAHRLIAHDQIEDLTENIANFSNLDKGIAQAIIDYGEGLRVKSHLDRFVNLDESIMAQLAELDKEVEETPTENLPEMFAHLAQGTATMDEVNQLIHEGQGWEVAKHIEQIPVDNHPEIAARLIEYGLGMAVIHYLHNFKNLSHPTIVEQLIEKDKGWMVAENLYAFDGIDHNAIAQSLIDHGRTSLVALNLHNFSNLNNSIAQELINYGYAYNVESHQGQFSNLDQSIKAQLPENKD